MFRYSTTLNKSSSDFTDADKSKQNMSSLRSLLYEDRYLSDRYYNDRYYHDRLTSLNGRNYWNNHYWGDRYNYLWGSDRYNYWDPYYHRYYNWQTNQNGTLRFPKNAPVVTATSKVAPLPSETRVWFPAPYTPPLWSAAIKNSDVKVVEATPLKRSNSFVSVSESKNETRVNGELSESKYDYKYQEQNAGSKIMSKSCSDMDVVSETEIN